MLTHAPENGYESSKRRILIVDDNPIVADSLARVLEAAHYETAVTLRGGDALEYAKKNPCAAALVDVHLPDLNGLDVSQQMRNIFGANTPIIVVSGDTSMEVINALSQAGATYFLSKPLNVPNLLDCLKRWIDGQG